MRHPIRAGLMFVLFTFGCADAMLKPAEQADIMVSITRDGVMQEHVIPVEALKKESRISFSRAQQLTQVDVSGYKIHHGENGAKVLTKDGVPVSSIVREGNKVTVTGPNNVTAVITYPADFESVSQEIDPRAADLFLAMATVCDELDVAMWLLGFAGLLFCETGAGCVLAAFGFGAATGAMQCRGNGGGSW